jgi:hypothetical protein
MPVFVRTGRGDLRLTLTSDGEVVDTQTAATPQEANRVAIMMLASRDIFDAGDTLTCRRADEDAPRVDETLVPAEPAPSPDEKHRRLAAISDPWWVEVVASMNLRPKLVHTPVNRDRTGFDGWGR